MAVCLDRLDNQGESGFCLRAEKTRNQVFLADCPGKIACLHRASSTGENSAHLKSSPTRPYHAGRLYMFVLQFFILISLRISYNTDHWNEDNDRILDMAFLLIQALLFDFLIWVSLLLSLLGRARCSHVA